MTRTAQPFDATFTAPVILLRPSWGEFLLGSRALKEHKGRLLEQASEIAEQGGGLLIIAYAEEYEQTIQLLLSLLMGQLRYDAKPAQLFLPQLESISDYELSSNPFLLVHNLPQCQGLIELLEGHRGKLPVIIATGIREQWEKLRIALPLRFYPGITRAGELSKNAQERGRQGELLRRARETELKQYAELNADDRKTYLRVALCDALGLPLPLALLARSLGRDEDTIGESVARASELQLLYCVEVERPPAFLVTTKSPVLARMMLAEIKGGELSGLLNDYATIISAVDITEKEERYAILNLFQSGLQAQGLRYWPGGSGNGLLLRRRSLRELVSKCRRKIDEVWQAGNAIEKLLWGKVFERLQMFDLSERVFSVGISKESNNPYLLHARARMLSVWARNQADKDNEAQKAFRQATQIAPDNPYLWQSWGILMAERGDVKTAREMFDRALSHSGAGERVYTLVAWANLEIEEGRYDRAEEKLVEIGDAPSNPYIPHVRAKKFFYQGDYGQAEASLNDVFQINPVSVEGWNLRGEIAFKRGHWKMAEESFKKALEIDSENIPTLRALADLEVDKGRFIAEMGEPQTARKLFQLAEGRLTEALELESDNLYCLVSYSVLLSHRASLEAAQGDTATAHQAVKRAESLLVKAQKLDAKNMFVKHSLGELKIRQGEEQEAEQLFRQMLDRDTENLSALISLYGLALRKQDDEEAQKLLAKVEQILGGNTMRSRLLPRHQIIKGYNAWAEVVWQAGRYEEALAVIEKSYALDPQNAYTNRVYARILQSLGQAAAAQQHAKQADDLMKLLPSWETS